VGTAFPRVSTEKTLVVRGVGFSVVFGRGVRL